MLAITMNLIHLWRFHLYVSITIDSYMFNNWSNNSISTYVHHCIQTQVYAQNEELRTQLEGSKRNENFLQEQISKAEQKLSDLHASYDELQMLTNGEEIKTQLSVTQTKVQDLKSEFSSIDVIKMHYAEEVMIINVLLDIYVYM